MGTTVDTDSLPCCCTHQRLGTMRFPIVSCLVISLGDARVEGLIGTETWNCKNAAVSDSTSQETGACLAAARQ